MYFFGGTQFSWINCYLYFSYPLHNIPSLPSIAHSLTQKKMKQSRFFSRLLLVALPFALFSCGGGTSDKDEKAGTDTAAVVTPAETPAPAVVNTIVTTPETMLTIVFKVSNYQKWMAVHEKGDSMRMADGLHDYVIGRGFKDSNMVLVAMKADDPEKAKAHVKMPGMKKMMQMAGVMGNPDISITTMTWQDTVNIGDALRSKTTFSVKNWSAWETSFKEGKQERMDNGIMDRVYGHDAMDSNKVSLVTAVTDTAKAFAYYKSDALKKRRAAGGVMGEPKRFLFRIVKRY